MPMREDCKHFQSRTYASGEVARFCVLDLAPEAPWRCPDECPRYDRRMADAGWVHGTLQRPSAPHEPEIIEISDEAAVLLDEAEDIINAAGPSILDEVRAERAKAERPNVLGKLRSRWRRRPR